MTTEAHTDTEATTQKDRDIAARLAELDDIRPQLDEHARLAKELTKRRANLLVELRDLGVPDKQMAEHTGQKVGTVTQAIRAEKLRRRGTPISRTSRRKK